MFLLVVTHNVNQFQVFSCEQQSIEIVCVQFLVFLFVFQSLKIRKEDLCTYTGCFKAFGQRNEAVNRGVLGL